MDSQVLKGLLALSAACAFLGMSATLLLRSPGLRSKLQASGLGCFGIMALAHVFETFTILSALGWGQPHSVGHFIDLTATLLGIVFVAVSFLLRG